MTRRKKTVVLWALATGMLATSTSPALAERNNTIASPAHNRTVTASTAAQSSSISTTAARKKRPKNDVERVGLPKCIIGDLRSAGARDKLYVHNYCKKTRHVKVIIDQGPDFECKAVKAGSWRRYSYNWPQKVSRIKKC